VGYFGKNGRFSATLKCGTKMNMPNELPRSDYLRPQIYAKKPPQFPIKVKLNFRGILKKF